MVGEARRLESGEMSTIYNELVPSDWADTSPHTSGMLKLRGVAMNYLDWGGNGPPIVLLPGLGDSPHVFDKVAPKLTAHHRVLGLSRRGHGESESPEGGYDPESLAADISAFLSALGLENTILVGHSIAGNEMTALAATTPSHIAGVVYMDAAYDRRDTSERIRLDPLTQIKQGGPQTPPRDLNAHRARALTYFGFWNDALEANLRARLRPDSSGGLQGAPAFVSQRIFEGSDKYIPHYDRIDTPVLALYAMFGKDHWAPYDKCDLKLNRSISRFMCEVMQPWQRSCIRALKSAVPDARIVELEGAHHYLFFSHEDRLVSELLEFASACTA